MSGIRTIVLLVIVVAVALLLGCPSQQPASQTESPMVANPAKAAGQASKDANAPEPEAAAGDQEVTTDVTALYEAKCAKCHDLTRIEGRTDTPEGWQETVKAMQAKDASWISDEEAEKIAAHLAAKYPQD